MTELKSKSGLYEDVIKATREAEFGVATCRKCGHTGNFESFLTFMFGGSLVYAACPKCLMDGHEVLVRRGLDGIEVLGRQTGLLSVGVNDVGLITKRPKQRSE